MHQFWTDGSSSIVTGQCGWAFIGIEGTRNIAAFGHTPGTNQVAELLAIKYALHATPKGAEVYILTDSQYSINCVTQYRQAWVSSGFITSTGQPVKNVDVIKDLWAAVDQRKVALTHIKGHNGNPGNEMADAISGIAREIAEGKTTTQEANARVRAMVKLDILVYVDQNGVPTFLKENEMKKAWPPLYKKNSSGEIQTWSICTIGADIITMWGVLGGKVQTTSETIAEGKNLGKANATTPETQAEAEAQARWEKQKKKKYVEGVEDAQAGKVDAVIEGGFDCMLAHKFRDHSAKIKYPAYLSRKLDGVRCIAVVEKGECSLWTRTRKPITNLPNIAEAVETAFSGETIILDGEIYAASLSADFEKLVSLVRGADNKEEREILNYHIFDIIGQGTFEERIDKLNTYKGKHSAIEIVEQTLVSSEEEALAKSRKYMLEGFEGGMVKNIASPYEHKRSYHLQKIKFFLADEFDIVGVTEGRGKLAGHAIFQCQTENGVQFEVKLEGEVSALKAYFENENLWKGKKLTVRYQGLTKKNKVPRFPVGVTVRDYE